jgi:hypothetical protein
MRRNDAPFVWIFCGTCQERWWFNPYSSGDDGLEECRNDVSHVILKIDALGQSVPLRQQKRSITNRTVRGNRWFDSGIVSRAPSRLMERYKSDEAEQTENASGSKFRRTSIRAGLRFDVLNRDKHTCQYCGGRAPEVKLHVDHVVPYQKVRKHCIDNLVTACESCNLGKSNKEIKFVHRI